MMEKREKNTLMRLFLNPKLLSFLGLVIIILISIPLAKNINKRRQANKEITELQKEIINIENKNTELKKMLDYLASDQYAESQARLNFGLKKGGEEAVIINLNSNQPQNNDEKSVPDSTFNIPGFEKVTEEKISNPRKWFDYYLNKF